MSDQIVEAGDADRLEHRGHVGFGMRNESHLMD
jgi:hypothetical protein